MYLNSKLLIGKNENKECFLIPKMLNRHGLITGASGSGKTITLKVIAESLSDAGIPVFLSDVKGDLGGTAFVGEENENVSKRVEKLHLENFELKKFPVRFWDIFEMCGHPIRTKISSIGPNILSIMLGLSETQEGVLDILFRIAKDENLELTDIKDLRSLVQYVNDNRKDYTISYGNITPQSLGVIQRSLLSLENQGAEHFFGEPALNIRDFISVNNDGKGIINILHAVELFKSPDLYASFMLWLLEELFNTLPEVGDLEKPKIVFFFDEAHLLFNEMPSYRLKKIAQVVKLIRSRGVGLFFISQNPGDIPQEVLGQLGNRIQHNLKAYTPAEQKNVKVAASSYRANPGFDTYDAILNLGTGEALVSFQTEAGEPDVVEKVWILPPQSKMGTIDDLSRNKIINNSDLLGKYDEKVDNETAHEKITTKYQEDKERQEALEREKEEANRLKQEEKERIQKEKEELREQKEKERAEAKAKKEEELKKKNNPVNKLTKKVANKAVDKAINKGLNSIFKSLFK